MTSILCTAASLLLPLLFLLSHPTTVSSVAPAGTLQRITKQQIVVSISPHADRTTATFLTSPSSKYSARFLRRVTAPGAGGFGNDFCYIQVVDSTTGQSVWESDCAPVSTANTCSLVFTDNGLEVYDGSRSSWDADVETDDNRYVKTLELVDEGDMRIRDDDGNLSWKASDSPQANQECGSPGSPGLDSLQPPFAAPIEQNRPFGQDGQVGVAAPEGMGDVAPPEGMGDVAPPEGMGDVAPPFASPVGQSQPFAPGGGEFPRSSPADLPSDPRRERNPYQQPLVDSTPFNAGHRGRGVCRLVAALAFAAASFHVIF